MSSALFSKKVSFYLSSDNDKSELVESDDEYKNFSELTSNAAMIVKYFNKFEEVTKLNGQRRFQSS